MSQKLFIMRFDAIRQAIYRLFIFRSIPTSDRISTVCVNLHELKEKIRRNRKICDLLIDCAFVNILNVLLTLTTSTRKPWDWIRD